MEALPEFRWDLGHCLFVMVFFCFVQVQRNDLFCPSLKPERPPADAVMITPSDTTGASYYPRLKYCLERLGAYVVSNSALMGSVRTKYMIAFERDTAF
jgi:hypothetical protein